MAEKSEVNLKKNQLDIDFYHEAFETLGYSKVLAQKRVPLYNRIAKYLTYSFRKWSQNSDNINFVTSGSRSEGLGGFFESDLDVLFVHQSVMCFESFSLICNETCPQIAFQLDFEQVPSGYAKLKLVTLEGNSTSNKKFLENIKAALVETNGYYYLRNEMLLTSALSNLYRGCLNKAPSVFGNISGPARSLNCDFLLFDISVDYVLAFPCSCSTVVDAWCKRERKYDWPRNALIEEVKCSDMLVVPAGMQGSTDQELQWRISLTFAERALVHSFNDAHIKVYGALKMLAKYELKPICDNITSYIVKNVIFWVFEKTNHFSLGGNFIDILVHCLQYLKMCIKWKYLPNYMISSKNMFENKISEREKLCLTQRLDIMIEEGPVTLLRCPLVREMTEWNKKEFHDKTVFRELVEQLSLSMASAPCEVTEIISKMFFSNRKSYLLDEDLINLIMNIVLPHVRKSNVLGFFTRLISMTNEEIYYCLLKGKLLAYDKAKICHDFSVPVQ